MNGKILGGLAAVVLVAVLVAIYRSDRASDERTPSSATESIETVAGQPGSSASGLAAGGESDTKAPSREGGEDAPIQEQPPATPVVRHTIQGLVKNAAGDSVPEAKVRFLVPGAPGGEGDAAESTLSVAPVRWPTTA